MRSLIAPLVLLATFLGVAEPARALGPTHVWSQRFGGTGADVGSSVAVDASGNVFVTGTFQGTASFGGSNLVSAGGNDIFLAKYNAAGVHQWSQRFGSIGNDSGNAVAVDASGNVFVTARFDGTVDFGGGNLVSAGGGDIVLAKYNTVGLHLWSQRFGDSGFDQALSVAVDASGNVFMTGSFRGTVDFGGGNLVGAGGDDIFIAKYNTVGLHLWSQRFGSPFHEVGNSVAVDALGNVIVTGYFAGPVDFGGGNLDPGFISPDIFLAKYNGAGVHQWSQTFAHTSFNYDQDAVGSSVAVDASGNVFMTGYFNGFVNLGGSTFLPVAGFDSDIFLAKYNAAGAHQWSQSFGGVGFDFGESVAVDASGSVFLTGRVLDTVDFGGGNLVGADPFYDSFVAKYNAAGAHMWSRRSGDGSGHKSGLSVVSDASGDVVTTGFFNSSVDLGGGALVSAGNSDVFVAKYKGETAEPVIATITDIGNDQGRQVNIRFERSIHDKAASATPIVRYEAYRRDDPPPAAFVVGENPLSRRELLDLGWTFVGEVPAHGHISYGLEAPTIGDSTVALGAYNSTFFIRAASDDPLVFFDSPTGTGHSLDNLAPPAPLNLAFQTGALTWGRSKAADFDFFTVYGTNTDSFASAVVVDYSVPATMNVSASPYAFYFVTATDFAGNESKPARVNTLSGVGGTPKSYVLSVSNYPNPFNPRTTVSYTVPSRGAVTITIYDANGARVATLFSGERAAGAYSVDWDGRTDGAAVAASGVYFARIEHSSGTRSKKMVLLK